MKCSTLISLALAARAVAAAGVLGAHRPRGTNLLAKGTKGTLLAKVVATPEDIAMCSGVAQQFLDKPVTKDQALEKAFDYCAVQKRVEDRNYVCPHLKEGLVRAFSDEPADRVYTVQDFCEITEPYMLALRGAARVPNMGEGPLFDFKTSDSCNPTISGALAPESSVPTASAGDFLYSICVNQDCAHFLQSRTRWCDSDRAPTHSIIVCEAARDFANDEAAVLGDGPLDADKICDVYAEFVKEMGNNVEAYEHVMHLDSRHRVPVPKDHVRALESSRMQHEAGSHNMRDGSGKFVEPFQGSAAAVPAGALAVTLTTLAVLLATRPA